MTSILFISSVSGDGILLMSDHLRVVLFITYIVYIKEGDSLRLTNHSVCLSKILKSCYIIYNFIMSYDTLLPLYSPNKWDPLFPSERPLLFLNTSISKLSVLTPLPLSDLPIKSLRYFSTSSVLVSDTHCLFSSVILHPT